LGGHWDSTNVWASSSGVTLGTVPVVGGAGQTGRVNPLHRPFPADGSTVRWQSWDGASEEVVTLSWENEGWTASGEVGGRDDRDGRDDYQGVQYVVRLSPLWQVRQFLLFRDLDEPDLWLGTDGHGRWGEVNGAHRVDLDGGIDIALTVTPFTHAIPIRRLALDVGQEAPTVQLHVDVETLGVVPAAATYRRTATHEYVVTTDGEVRTITVDDHGLPVDVEPHFRRV
jgi:hypothetical protein